MTALHLVRYWRWIGGALITAAFAWLLWSYADRGARIDELQRDVATERQLRADAERRTMVLERASAERESDRKQIDDLGKDLNDAIDNATAGKPPAAPGAATRALGCERLRRAGQTTSGAYRSLCGRAAGQ